MESASSSGGTVKKADSLVPLERIERSIHLIRGHRIMLDADLAPLYGVPQEFEDGGHRL
jgi:hypothetical protein